ncbi:hypothetical protein BHM03_00046903, partial [Ensete ventricosum]
LFSPYGEIIELRMIKDQEGNSKVHGKSIHVALSSDQDSLFFGNLHKGRTWFIIWVFNNLIC